MALTPTLKMTVLYVAQNPSHHSIIVMELSLSFEHFAEHAGRLDQQNQKQETERHRIAEVARNVRDGQHFGKAEEQTADHRAADVAHAAQDDDGDALVQHRLTHEGRDRIEGQADQYARCSTQCGGGKRGQVEQAFDVDAQQVSGFRRLGDSAQRAAQLRAAHHGQQHNHQHESDDDDADLYRSDVHVADGDAVFRDGADREALVLGAEQTLREVGQHDRDTDGGNHGNQVGCIALAQRLQHQEVDDEADQTGGDHCREHGQPERQRQFFDQQQGGIATQHEDRAVRQIDDAEYAEYQREPQRKERIDAA